MRGEERGEARPRNHHGSPSSGAGVAHVGDNKKLTGERTNIADLLSMPVAAAVDFELTFPPNAGIGAIRRSFLDDVVTR